MNEQPRESAKTEANRNPKGNAWRDLPEKDCRNVNTLRVLNAVNENAVMAKEAIEVTLKSVNNMEFADILRQQTLKYDDFVRRSQSLANNLGCILETKNKVGRAMARMSIRMKLLGDNSTTNIAEMILLGTTNGIVDLGKLIRHTPDVHKDALALAKELLIYEEDKVELMKYHL